MKRVLGLINLHHSTELKVLNARRSVASTSFLGRYSFIDFPLSNFANSDINQIGVLIKEKTRSLFRHLGVTEQVWTQNSKTGGIYLMNNEDQSNNPKLNHDINNIEENIWVLKNAKADLVVFAPVHFLMRVDYRKMLNQHVKSNVDITLLYYKLKGAKRKWLNTQTLSLEANKVLSFSTNKGTEDTANVFLESYVISKALLLKLIKEAKAISPFNSLRDMLRNHSKNLKMMAYEHKEYVRLIEDETNFMNTSLELLNLEVIAQLFKESWPIYTRTYDTPPAKYGPKAKIANSYVANGSLVLGTVSNSIIGRDVVIEEGASVENSIIMSHVRVPANTKLNHAIIDKEAKIKSGASLFGESDKPLIIKQEGKAMNILFAVAEAVPFAKTGGLADVGGELPKYLVKLGAKVTVIMPKHGQIKQAYAKDFKFEKWFTVNILNKEEYVGVFSYKMDGVDYYFIDNETFFKREGLYGYDDDHVRYGYFCIAAVELIKSLELKLNIISLHDWQSSMIAPIIRENHRDHPLFKDTKLIVTIHNPAYQGWCEKDNLWNIFKISMETYHSGQNRHKDGLSYLKSGLMYADKITTVSPNHVKELMRGEHSFGLEGLLRYRGEDFIGILNGIDYVNYDPTTDKIIKQTFNKFDKGKLVNKKFLQQQFNLAIDNNIPLISIVSRLVFQKGIDLIIKNIDYMMSRGAQLVVLGSGEYQLEQSLEYYRAKYSDQIGIYMGYNEDLARKIYAGSDMFLMPSLFEPCGIGQMIAMRYGTVPIARATGGLYDTIIDFDKDSEAGDGFLFSDYDEWGLRYALSQGLDAYKSRMKWKKIVTNAMEKDNSWENSAQAYFNFYNQTINRKK